MIQDVEQRMESVPQLVEFCQRTFPVRCVVHCLLFAPRPQFALCVCVSNVANYFCVQCRVWLIIHSITPHHGLHILFVLPGRGRYDKQFFVEAFRGEENVLSLTAINPQKQLVGYSLVRIIRADRVKVGNLFFSCAFTLAAVLHACACTHNCTHSVSPSLSFFLPLSLSFALSRSRSCSSPLSLCQRAFSRDHTHVMSFVGLYECLDSCVCEINTPPVHDLSLARSCFSIDAATVSVSAPLFMRFCTQASIVTTLCAKK